MSSAGAALGHGEAAAGDDEEITLTRGDLKLLLRNVASFHADADTMKEKLEAVVRRLENVSRHESAAPKAWQLVFTNEFPVDWYVQRKLDPPLTVQVVERVSHRPVTDVQQMPVVLEVLDGERNPVNISSNGTPVLAGTTTSVVVNGLVEFDNLSFTEVSSKHHRVFFIRATMPNSDAAPAESTPIRVLAKAPLDRHGQLPLPEPKRVMVDPTGTGQYVVQQTVYPTRLASSSQAMPLPSMGQRQRQQPQPSFSSESSESEHKDSGSDDGGDDGDDDNDDDDDDDHDDGIKGDDDGDDDDSEPPTLFGDHQWRKKDHEQTFENVMQTMRSEDR